MKTWSDFDTKLRDVAVIDLKLAETARHRNETQLAAQTLYDAVARPLMASRGCVVAELERFYRANRKQVEADGRKSIELNFGRAGLRLGNPTLALRKGWNWDKVLQAIKDRWKKRPECIAVKETVNKEAVKAVGATEEELKELGLRIKQDEEFFVETYTDKVDQAAA